MITLSTDVTGVSRDVAIKTVDHSGVKLGCLSISDTVHRLKSILASWFNLSLENHVTAHRTKQLEKHTLASLPPFRTVTAAIAPSSVSTWSLCMPRATLQAVEALLPSPDLLQTAIKTSKRKYKHKRELFDQLGRQHKHEPGLPSFGPGSQRLSRRQIRAWRAEQQKMDFRAQQPRARGTTRVWEYGQHSSQYRIANRRCRQTLLMLPWCFFDIFFDQDECSVAPARPLALLSIFLPTLYVITTLAQRQVCRGMSNLPYLGDPKGGAIQSQRTIDCLYTFLQVRRSLPEGLIPLSGPSKLVTLETIAEFIDAHGAMHIDLDLLDQRLVQLQTDIAAGDHHRYDDVQRTRFHLHLIRTMQAWPGGRAPPSPYSVIDLELIFAVFLPSESSWQLIEALPQESC